MNVDKELEKEVLTRLLHAHPNGLGTEVLDNYRGEKAVADTLARLEELGWIQEGHLNRDQTGEYILDPPIKLTSTGVEMARKLDT